MLAFQNRHKWVVWWGNLPLTSFIETFDYPLPNLLWGSVPSRGRIAVNWPCIDCNEYHTILTAAFTIECGSFCHLGSHQKVGDMDSPITAFLFPEISTVHLVCQNPKGHTPPSLNRKKGRLQCYHTFSKTFKRVGNRDLVGMHSKFGWNL